MEARVRQADTRLNPFIALHVFVYKLTVGRVGGKTRGAPVLLLTTLGRRSGKHRTTPVLFLQRKHDWVIVASNAGDPRIQRGIIT